VPAIGLGLLAPLLIAASLLAPESRAADDPEGAIRAALAKWTEDFNSGKEQAVCALFAADLRYDFRGFPERNYDDICSQLQASLRDETKNYSYSLDIREILVAGDLAVVRLVWTLSTTLGDGREVTSVEPGMDVFRRQPDGSWKIIRYIAYEAPESDADQQGSD
jgi:steroid delta-isomerase